MKQTSLPKLLTAFIASLAFFCIDSPAWAQEAEFAVVVMVTEKEIIFDKGTVAGVNTGDKVRLYRKITVHHPITGEQISDKFPIADVKVDKASDLLSIIRNSKKLSYVPKAGDLVQFLKPPRETAPETVADAESLTHTGSPLSGGAPLSGEVNTEKEALNHAIMSSAGRRINRRILYYRQFLEKYPSGQYAELVSQEIAWLHKMNKSLRQPRPVTVSNPVEEEKLLAKQKPPKVLHSPIGLTEVGDTIQVVVAIVPRHSIQRVNLYVRFSDEEGFEQFRMRHTEDYYYRIEVEKKYLSHAGTFDYFVEAVAENREAWAVVGKGKEPLTVEVVRPTVDTIKTKDRSTTRVVFDYVDFDMDESVDDEYISFEADFFYRIRTFLYGVRVGTGIFNGTGGYLNAIEESTANNEELSAVYGYLEGEFEIARLFHFMVRGLAGNKRSPGEQKSQSSGVFGLEGGIRIGEETNTNLSISGSIFEDVGYEARIALEINHFKKVPITLEGLATNFPVDVSHVGMRMVVGAGYRFTDWFAVLARGSWNARTIKHTGFGGGASVALSW